MIGSPMIRVVEPRLPRQVIGDIERSVSSIQDLSIPDAEKEWIFSENLKALLKLSR